ncbi:MAG: hypothetical protein JST50_11420 [Bacteroidetes bacterium]|jgi:hypothetical protein|nr:hypothetical protein [Bacteroidota bacterium]
MTTVKKVYKIQESSGSINNIETRREWIYRVNVVDDLKNYPSYAIYYSIRQEAAYLAMVYVDIDGKMIPRVTKPSPEDHYDNWMYALALDGFAFKIEELFDKENILYQKFADVKEEEDIYTIDIEPVN